MEEHKKIGEDYSTKCEMDSTHKIEVSQCRDNI